MDFLTGGSRKSWQPVMGPDTTVSSYWLNWRVFLCSVWILTSMAVASYLITKYEGRPHPRKWRIREEEEESEEEDNGGVLYDDEVWKPCLKGIHPAWLLTFRIIAFIVLLILLILNAIVDGGSIFYYYTQWTFTLITIYFGLGTLLSIYGCNQYHNKVGGDEEQAPHVSTQHEITNMPSAAISKFSIFQDPRPPRRIAGFWGYAFQIMFQMQAGAIVLTDCVFWFIIVPFLAIKDYDLNFFIINMHSINAVFLLGDTALNSLRFPWFRIAYFILWTCVFVVFQWIVHACIAIWWPYPFLELQSPFSPLWYSSVALLHVPCYGIFVLVIKLKHFLLLKWFPESSRYAR